MSQPDDELAQLMEKYHLPQAAGEDLALRQITSDLRWQFHFREGKRLANGNWFQSTGTWFQPLYFSQSTQRDYKKYHAPAGLIIDEEKSILDYAPKRVAEFMAHTTAKDYGREDAEDILRGLSKVVDWLTALQTELAEKLKEEK
jgi:hypothetical protein